MQGPSNNRLATAICACLTATALASTAAMAGESVDSSTKAETRTTDRSPTGLSMYTSDAANERAAMEADQATTGSTTATEMRSDPGSASSTTTHRDSASTSGTSDTSTSASGATTMAPGTTAVSPSPHDRSTTGDYDPRTSTERSGMDGSAKDRSTTDYDQSRTGGARSASSAGAGPDAVVWYMFPVALETQSNNVSKGCWVRLYSGDEFEGRSIYIVGPTNISEMRSPYGTGMNNWESAEVGPNATVTTYDDENFGSRNATLNAGQRYPDLDDSKLGLFDDIESLKVNCRTSTGTGGTN